MAIEAEQFREWLLIYGADLQQWPEAVRRTGLAALERSVACRTLREDHIQFETVLRTRRYEAPSQGLEVRIIAAAARRKRSEAPGLGELLRSCFADLRISAPVLMAAAVLIVGIIIGLWLPTEPVLAESDPVEAQLFSDAATEVL